MFLRHFTNVLYQSYAENMWDKMCITPDFDSGVIVLQKSVVQQHGPSL